MVSRRTWFTFSGAIASSSLLGYLALVGFQLWCGRSLGSAAAAALLPAVLWTSSAVLLARSSWSGWMPSRRRRTIQAVLWAAMVGVVAVILLSAMGVPFSGPIGVLVTMVALIAYRRTVTTAVTRNTRLPQATSSVEGIDDLIAASRRQLEDPTMPPSQRAMVTFNLASSLTNREAVGDNPAAFLEAAGLLDGLLSDPTLDLPTRSLVAMELCGTKSMLASVTGSDEGWQDAIDRMFEVARRLPDDENGRSSVMRAHDEQAQLHLFHLSEIGPDVEGEFPVEWHEHRAAALTSLRKALALASPRSELRPHLLTELGVLTFLEDQEAGIGLLRQAFEQARRRPLAQRQDVQLALAAHLLMRARFDADEDQAGARPAPVDEDVEKDLAQAERLATQIAESSSLLDGHAAELLAEISQFRARRRVA